MGVLETEYFLTIATEQCCRRAEISGFRDLGLRSRELYMLVRAGLLFPLPRFDQQFWLAQ